MKTMSPREVAQTLGVHLDWVYRLLRVGKLGGRKANRGKSGGVWVISQEAVKALQEERKRREEERE